MFPSPLMDPLEVCVIGSSSHELEEDQNKGSVTYTRVLNLTPAYLPS